VVSIFHHSNSKSAHGRFYPGAAGNFLAPIAALSENAFKTVIEIDMVRNPFLGVQVAQFQPIHRKIGTFNTIKATLPYVRKSQGAYIHVSATLHYSGRLLHMCIHYDFLLMTSISPGVPHQSHASAAKAGVDALSAVLAVEEGPNGVRSNVVAPGAIANTEGFVRLALGDKKRTSYPLGREGVIGDIANATVFLFSDAASYITGQVLPVDGGSWFMSTLPVAYPEAVLDTGKETKSRL